MALLDDLLASVGKSRADLPANTKTGRLVRRRGVSDSADLERVSQLPRLNWETHYPEELIDLLTAELKTRWGTMRLKSIQAAALATIHDLGGMLGPIPVGGGKTIISFLAAPVLGAQRPLLIVPAKLVKKTQREMKELREHWVFPIPKIITYEYLSRVNAKEFLGTRRPDLIVCDEAHKLKNTKAACTRRVRRYLEAKGTKCAFIALSGTLTNRSIKEYAHQTRWALHGNAPVPLSYQVTEEWSLALDEKVPAGSRMAPGGLAKLCDKPPEDLAEVRQAYRDRLLSAPGVISTQVGYEGSSLNIRATVEDLPKDVGDLFETMRKDWLTPDGWPISDPVTLWRHARELACGFYYVWDPRPPQDWLAARSEWCACVREIIANRPYDSEFEVKLAVESGAITSEAYLDAYNEWEGTRGTFEVNSEPRWVATGPLDRAKKWMAKNKGIVWVEHTAFGLRLAKETGQPYFRQGGLCNGVMIEDAHPRDGSIIASIASNAEGRNLQHNWSKNYIASAPPTGSVWEQLIGRTHREGQPCDEVDFEIPLACLEQWSGLQQAIADARYVQQTTKQNQKLLYGTLDIPTPDDIVSLTAPQWVKK